MRHALTTIAATALLLSTAACSMPGSDDASSDPKPGDTSLTVNDHKVTTPKNYVVNTYSKTGTVTEITLVNKKSMPTNITVASNPKGFNVDTWCGDMEKMLKENFAPGAKVSKKKTSTSCEIIGHGKTGGMSPSASPSTSASPSASTSSNAPSGSGSSSPSTTPNTIKPGTDYSIITTVKKAANGSYVAMMSRQLEANYPFTDERAFFTTISK